VTSSAHALEELGNVWIRVASRTVGGRRARARACAEDVTGRMVRHVCVRVTRDA
jgi:hypothetical protein